MAFLLIMVATGWVWSRAEERVSRWHSQESAFFRRERERDPREVKNSRERIQENIRGVSWVFNLGLLTPPNGCLDQLGSMLERLLRGCSTQSIN